MQVVDFPDDSHTQYQEQWPGEQRTTEEEPTLVVDFPDDSHTQYQEQWPGEERTTEEEPTLVVDFPDDSHTQYQEQWPGEQRTSEEEPTLVEDETSYALLGKVLLVTLVLGTFGAAYWVARHEWRHTPDGEDITTSTPVFVGIPKLPPKYPFPDASYEDYEDTPHWLTTSTAEIPQTTAEATMSTRITQHPFTDKECDTEDCQYMRWLIGVSVDTGKDPCENFYSYVCNGALRSLSHWYDVNTNFNLKVIQRNITLNMARNLQDVKVPRRGQTGYQKVAAFYQDCINVDNVRTTEAMRQFLKQQGMTFASDMQFDLLHAMVKFSFCFNIDLIFRIQARWVGEQVVLYMGQDIYIRFAVHEDREARKETITQILSAILSIDLRDLANEIIAVENNLAYLSQVQYTGNETSGRKKLMFLFSKLGLLVNNDTTLSERWNQALEDNTDSRLPKDVKVSMAVNDVHFFHNLFGKFRNATANELRIFFAWRTARYLYQESLFNPSYRDRSSVPDVIMCLDRTVDMFPNTAGSGFLFPIVNSSRLYLARDMIQTIVDEIKKSFESSHWLDETTRVGALKKLSVVKKHIGYLPEFSSALKIDEFFKDLPDLNGPFIENYIQVRKFWTKQNWNGILSDSSSVDSPYTFPPHVVNGAYIATLNRIFITAALLFTPIFSYGAPPEVNYGALGSVVTHELMHGYDTFGRNYDGAGHFKPWFTGKSIAEYDKIIRCHNETIENAPKARAYEDYDIEYLADTMGTTSLLRAYKKASEKSHVTLGNVRDFTKDKIFYISRCLVWCGKEFPEVRSLTHPPLDERCNVPLMNSQHFSETFSCPKDSPMNPSHKCVFW
ncbi:endothelin-converting enzyme homolog isoform X2 [Ornithodoros turicata]|uniref:endothelin-converting enzyme homolog isoform X2 n=1 Tax=Ornithodoros turicata TaxID=34597 RepID=UPI003139A2F4